MLKPADEAAPPPDAVTSSRRGKFALARVTASALAPISRAATSNTVHAIVLDITHAIRSMARQWFNSALSAS
jgi:hypothetical protein